MIESQSQRQIFSFLGFQKKSEIKKVRLVQVTITNILIFAADDLKAKVLKYTIKISYETAISWIISKPDEGTVIFDGFTFNHKDKFKTLYAPEDSLMRLREILQCRIFFRKVSEFYESKKVLGQGSFGCVMKTVNLVDQQEYAVKALKKDSAGLRGEKFELFTTEIDFILSLQRSVAGTDLEKNFIKIHEIYEGESSLYIVMDLLKGRTLKRELQALQSENQMFDREIIRSIMKQLLLNLQHMHKQGIMHRDLKPDNIMFRNDNDFSSLCIIDFGLSTLIDVQSFHYARCGTPGYVAPEILNLREKNQKYTQACDIFSCGVIFYQLLTGGELLFKAADRGKIIQLNKKCEINIGPQHQFSKEEYELLIRMLDKNPKDRISVEEALQMPYITKEIDYIVKNREDSWNRASEKDLELIDDEESISQVKQFPQFNKLPLSVSSTRLIAKPTTYTYGDPRKNKSYGLFSESGSRKTYGRSFYMKSILSGFHKEQINSSMQLSQSQSSQVIEPNSSNKVLFRKESHNLNDDDESQFSPILKQVIQRRAQQKQPPTTAQNRLLVFLKEAS